MVPLCAAEKAEVVANCDHLQKLKFSKVLPYAFTKHGVIQAANVLANAQADQRSACRLGTELGLSTERLELSHDTLSRNTGNQLRQVFETLRELADKVTPPEPAPSKRPIGFLPLDNNDKPKRSAKAVKALKSGQRKKK